jgi:hypothetical protein
MNKIALIMKHLMSLVVLITTGMTLLYPVQAGTFPKGEIEGIWKGLF